MRVIWLCLFCLLPFSVNAAVSISEVAWMGSTESANYEWIELHNDGSGIDVTGWSLNDGMNLEIELEGYVTANSHVVLERTSDGSAPGTAFLIYTGALVNSGATLRLLRADGSLVDQVAGGEDWENIGGDNVTKETAQYTTAGWKTAPATPGQALVWSDETESEVNQTESNEETKEVAVKSKSGSSKTVRLELPDVTLALDVDGQSIGYVNQPIFFTVEPSGIGEHLIDSLNYQWNFGDGSTATNKEARHVFGYPGKYVVTVHGFYKRQEQVSRHEITILPVSISLSTNRQGDVQINNDSPYELDISGYRIRGEKVFTFPPYSILLPNQTVTIASNKLGKVRDVMVALYDTETEMLAAITPADLQYKPNTFVVEDLSPAPQISAMSFSRQAPIIETQEEVGNFAFATTFEEAEAEDMESPPAASASSSLPTQLANAVSSEGDSPAWPFWSLIGVLSLGVVGVYAFPRRNDNV